MKYESYRAKDLSQVTFKLDQETVYKVIKQPLPKGTLWMKYESDWSQGEKL